MATANRPHFSLLGFPVRVTPFYLLLLVFLALWGVPEGTDWDARFFGRIGIILAVVTASILWHELGHAILMRRYGFTPSIQLHGLGGLTSWGRGPGVPTPMQRVWVSLAGPGAGLLLGAPFLVLLFITPTGSWALDLFILLMVIVNVGWGMLNLLPMVPWDGGLAVHGLLDRITGGRGATPTAILTIVVAVLAGLAAWQLLDSWWWPALLCWMSVARAVRMIRAERAASTLPVPDAIQGARAALEQVGSPRQLVAAILMDRRTQGFGVFAAELEQRVIPRAERPDERAAALELAAWGYLMADQVADAARLAEAMRPSHDPSPILAALVATRTGDLDALERTLDEIDEPTAERWLRAYLDVARGRMDDALTRLGDDREGGAVVDSALYHGGRFADAAALAEALFERHGAAKDAYNAACSHARDGRPELALRWLERAIGAGFDDLATLETDDDLAGVRALPAGRALLDRLRAEA